MNRAIALLPLALLACPANDTSIIQRANEGPEVVIWSPADGAAFPEGAAVDFTGTVEDDRTSPGPAASTGPSPRASWRRARAWWG